MISAVVPWSPGCPYRERVLPWVLDRLRGLVDEVVVGETSGQWCKAAAVANGLERASGDVLIVHDADVFIEDSAWVEECVGALEEHAWASPHDWVNRLTSMTSNERVMAGSNPWAEPRNRHEAFLGGGIVVLRRSTYEDCPLDRRYVGWGQEDESWANALATLHGKPFRGDRALWHLFHPPQERINRRWGSTESMELCAEYEAATGNVEAMRTLIGAVR